MRVRLFAIIATLGVAFASAAHGQDARPRSSPALDPDVEYICPQPVTRPERFYPRRAMQSAIEGYAKVDCAYEPSGRIHSCRAVIEEPTGWGFGAAAVRLACAYRLTETATGGRYEINIPFKLK
jgi:hypothetical protein